MSQNLGESYNIAALMEAQARVRPTQRGVVFPEGRDSQGRVGWTHLTFEGLNRLADEYARGFLAQGIQRGDRVSLLVKPCLSFIPMVFAVFKIGAVPVLIDPGMGVKPFLSCVKRVAPQALIAESAVHGLAALGLARGAFSSVKVPITMGRFTWWWGGATLEGCRIVSDEPFEAVHTERDDVAAILFTSGSTGPAKGVVYTHGIFNAQTRHIQSMYGIEPGEIDLACFPLFGLFSMAMGMTVVLPDMDPTKPALADPVKLVEAITTQGCTSAFGSPAIWKNLAKRCTAEGIKLPSLKRILMAGAPVPVWMHEAFQDILAPGAELHAPYGATESLPVASLGSRVVLEETHAITRVGGGTCVGHLAPGIEARIIKISDDPIETWADVVELSVGEIGEICVQGEVATRSYLNEPGHTAAAKIQAGDGFFHRMGDVGYLDEKGRLWFCGRKSHRVITPEGTLFSVCCEAIFNEHPAVARTALVGVDGVPAIVVELEKGVAASEQSSITEALLGLGAAHALTAGIKRVLYHPSFPVDVRHNAKIHRGELATWARGQR